MKTSLKDWPKVYRRLRNLPWMSREERILFARSQAATPDERWEMNANCIKALGLGGPVRSLPELERRKEKLRRFQSPRVWQLCRSNGELKRGQMYGALELRKILCGS